MWLIVGLGNPGNAYKTHRHNVGFMAVDVLRTRYGSPKCSSMFGGEVAFLRKEEPSLLSVKPMEYMNLSGRAVNQVARFYKILPEEIIVIHDELDLPFGQLKLKQDGGAGGHNGLRSIIDQIGARFIRVRVGIGRPSFGDKEQVSNYVLSPFDKSQQNQVVSLLDFAADAVQTIVDEGVAVAMNRYNRTAVP